MQPLAHIPLLHLAMQPLARIPMLQPWDWLGKCPPALVDETLLPLALLRLAIRFEGAKDHEEAALKLFEPLGGEAAILSFERRLVEALWSAKGLADGVEFPSQPLAR